MKIIYSYINQYDPSYIPLDSFFIGLHSALKSTNLYGNADFFTSKEVIKKIKNLKLPFTNLIEFSNNQNSNIDIIPKLITYTLQKEPYIHLDMDLILNEKLNIEDTLPVQFAHRDVEKNWSLSLVNDYNKCYFEPAKYFNEKYGLGFNHILNFCEIPNMGIVSVHDVDLFSKCTNDALNLYYENKNVFDNNFSWNVYLEQATIHKKLKENSEEYRQSIINEKQCFFDKSILFKVEKNNKKTELFDFYNDEKKTFTSFKNILDDNFLNELPSIHFMGNLKKSNRVQLLIIHSLIQHFGLYYVQKIVKEVGDNNYPYLDTYLRYIKFLS
jgi:hypothetical protein